jgi:hypothetical protein
VVNVSAVHAACLGLLGQGAALQTLNAMCCTDSAGSLWGACMPQLLNERAGMSVFCNSKSLCVSIVPHAVGGCVFENVVGCGSSLWAQGHGPHAFEPLC